MNNRIYTVLAALLASFAGVSDPVFAQIAIVEHHETILRSLEQFPPGPTGSIGSWASAVTSLGDLDGEDGSAAALVVGRHRVPFGSPTEETGIAYVVFLDEFDQIIPEMIQPIHYPESPKGDRFGQSCGAIGDIDGDGVTDVGIGAPAADDGGANAGALWIFLLYPNGTVKAHHKISANTDLPGLIGTEDAFATSVAYLGILQSPYGPRPAIAVGEPNDDDGGFNTGAVWILFLDPDGSVAHEQKINTVVGGFEGSLSANDKFGFAVSALGDLDGDGVVDMAVGAPRDDHDSSNIDADFGAIWVLFMNANGTVREEARVIIDGIRIFAEFGDDIDVLGPLDPLHPERVTLAVGTPERNTNLASVWLVEVDPFGSLVRETQIGPELDGYDDFEGFGITLASMGDLDGNGFPEIAVGDPGSDVAGHNYGALHILHLAAVNLDTDGDGVNDADDACPDSDLSPTIVIDGEDTGVSNELLDDGCTISDLIAELLAQDSSTNVIVQFLVDLKGDGIINGQEMGAILQSLNSP